MSENCSKQVIMTNSTPTLRKFSPHYFLGLSGRQRKVKGKFFNFSLTTIKFNSSLCKIYTETTLELNTCTCKLTCAIFVSFNTFRAFLNGVGVRGDTLNNVLLIRGVRKGSSVELVSSKPGVLRVVFVRLT